MLVICIKLVKEPDMAALLLLKQSGFEIGFLPLELAHE